MTYSTPKIIVDVRESSTVINELKRLGAELIADSLTVGDYIVAEDFAVERKAFGDFIQSIYDGRIFDQVNRLCETYNRSALIIEGNLESELSRMKNDKVFWGALSRIIADYPIQVVLTINEVKSAELIFQLAQKSQKKGGAPVIRFKPKTNSLMERQLLAVQGLPDIGPELAFDLLCRFRTVKGVFSANMNELMTVTNIGRKRAEGIVNFVNAQFKEEIKNGV